MDTVTHHDVRVCCITHEHKLALRVGQEDLIQEKATNLQGCRHIREVEGSSIERSERISLVNESFEMSAEIF